ncbi:MAG: porin family protein [Bacteroidota bacterium]
MTHSCVLLVVLGLSCMNASGQAAILVYFFGDKVASEKFYLSLDGGLNVAQMTNFDEGDARLGINFGLGTHIRLGDQWYLEPEFKPLSRKGARNLDIPFELDDELQVEDASSDLRLNYIDIPIPLQFKTKSGFYLSTGPQFSFLTGARQITEVSLIDGTTVTVDDDVSERFESFDFGWTGEVGYEIPNQRDGKGLEFRLRYARGFTEVWKEDAGFSSHHSVFQLMVVLPFINPPKSEGESNP